MPDWTQYRSGAGTSTTPATADSGDPQTAIKEYRRDHKVKPSTPPSSSEQAGQALSRLLHSPDPQAKKAGRQYLVQHIHEIKPGDLSKYGVPDKEIAGILAQEKLSGKPNIVARGLGTVLGVIGRPAQAALELVQAGAVDAGLPGVDKPEAHKGGYKDAWRALIGDDKHRYNAATGEQGGPISFTNALGRVPASEGNGGFLGDKFSNSTAGHVLQKTGEFAGSAAVDPLNLIGGGSETALRTAVEHGSEIAAADIARTGLRDLAPALRKELASSGAKSFGVKEVKEALAKTGVKKGLTATQRTATQDSLRQALVDASKTQGIAGRASRSIPIPQAEEAAGKTIKRAIEFDRGGVRIPGHSIVPRATLHDAGVAARLVDDVKPVLPRTGKFLKEADAAVTDLAQLSSEAVAETSRLRAAEAAAASGGADAATRAAAATATKEAEDHAAELLTKLRSATAARATTDTAALSDLFPHLGSATDATKKVVKRGLTGAIKRSGFGSGVRDAILPRARILDSLTLPANAEPAVRRAFETTRAEEAALNGATHGQLVEATQQLDKTGGKLAEALTPAEQRIISKALDTGGDVAATAARFRSIGKEGHAALLETLDKIGKSGYDTLTGQGLANADALAPRGEYLMRDYTKEGQKALALSEKQGGKAGLTAGPTTAAAAGSQAGRLNPRVIMPDAPAHAVEARLGSQLKREGALKAEDKLLETNPLYLVAKRDKQINRAAAQASAIDHLSETLKDPLGGKLVERIRPDAAPEVAAAAKAAAEKRGLVPVELSGSGTAYVHPSLKPEIEKTVATLTQDENLKHWQKFFDKWNAVWKGYATTPVIGGVGFHTRNSVGNVFNNWLAGVRDPKFYAEALHIQNEVRTAVKEFPELDMIAAVEARAKRLASEGKTGHLGGLTKQQVRYVEAAQERGVIDEGFTHVDLKPSDAVGKSTAAKVRGRLNPVGSDNALQASGRRLGSAVEDNARMAHFLSKVNETGDLAAAADSVKKYLFDYGDLTAFEKEKLRRIVPFYTYMRKNLPVQAEALIQQPAKIHRALLAQSVAFGGGDGQGRTIPNYLLDGNNVLDNKFSDAISGKGNPVIASVDTPVSAALDNIKPVVHAAALIPGVKDVLPKGLRPDDGAAQVSREFLNVPSGGPTSALKFLVEEATGTGLYTGAPIKDRLGVRKKNILLRLTDAVAPVVSKTDRTWNLTGNDTDNTRLRILKGLSGLNLAKVTQEMSDKERAYQVSLLQEQIAKLQKKGIDVPTIPELRGAGLIPKAPSKAKKHSATSGYTYHR